MIDLEDGDVIGALIAGDDVLAGRVDAEVARRAAERFLVAGSGELAGFFVDREDRQAVVTAVGAIDELAAGMNLDFGRRIALRRLGESW